MQPAHFRPALDAVIEIASEHGLQADDVEVLHDSNRLTLRLLPCDVVARVATESLRASAEFEVEMARRLTDVGGPVAALDPRIGSRVHVRDGFAFNFWTWYEPLAPAEIAPAEYAQALARLHAGLRSIDLPAPHVRDRIAEAERLVDNPALSPALAEPDRVFLSDTLRKLKRSIAERGGAEQLLHCEPHPGNLLRTQDGLLFIDLETCCRGPIEFDLAGAPEAVSEHYPGVDRALLHECRVLTLALIAAWRWDRDDRFADGVEMGREMLSQIRVMLDRDEEQVSR